MSKSLSQSVRTHWKRALSMLLVLLTVLGMFPSTAFASDSVPAFDATGDFEVNIAGATGWNAFPMSLSVYDEETGGEQIATIPALSEDAPIAFVILEDNGGNRVEIGLAYDVFAVLLGVILTAGFPEGDCLDLFLMLAVKFRYILFVFVFFVRRRVRQQNAPHKAYANNCTET